MNLQKNPIFPCVLFLVLSFIGPFAQAAEPPAPSSPESVVESYLQAMRGGQYLKLAELIHPEGLEKFRSMFLPLIEEAKRADPPEDLLTLFRGVGDVTELKKLSPAEFFAAFFGGIADVNPGLAEALTSARMTPIGSVPEGDIIHIVCRTTVEVEGFNGSKVEVISLRRSAGNWRVILPESFESIVQALSSGSGKT